MKKQKFQYGVSAIRQARHEEYGLADTAGLQRVFAFSKDSTGKTKKKLH